MPARRRVLTLETVAELAAMQFTPVTSEQLCGIELEWPVYPSAAPWARPSYETLAAISSRPLPAHGKVTIEPGGQIELSTTPADCMDATLDAAAIDSIELESRLRAEGLVCAEWAVDTGRVPERVLHAPRYAAMERFFLADGDAGRWMMCNTAGMQINISHDPIDPAPRWNLLHRLGPVLVAMFANSPGVDSQGQRWQSLRQGIWWALAPQRTRPANLHAAPELAWLDYALEADVMLIRGEDDFSPMEPGFSFQRWMVHGHEAGWPTADDFAYHLTTLFPPIRPRGWLELRMLDALPAELRDVAALTVAAALTPDAAAELDERLPQTATLWAAAARHGLEHPVLALGSRLLMDVAVKHLPRVTKVSGRADRVLAFADRYVRAGTSPAQLITTGEVRSRLKPVLDRSVPPELAITGLGGGPVWRCWR